MSLIKSVIIAMAVTVGSAGIVATQTAGSHASHGRDVARSIAKGSYGAVGTRICGRKCGKAGRYLGGKAFDTGNRFSKWYSGKTGAAGRYLRKKYQQKRRRR